MAVLLKFDTLVYAKSFFTEDHPPKCMYLPGTKILEKMMKAFLNFDEKVKKIEPSLADVLIKFGVTSEDEFE